MRIILAVLFSVYSFNSFAQVPVPVISTKIIYSGVVQVDSVTKNELYYRAKRFLIDEFKNAKGGIQQDDKEDGVIICKGRTRLNNVFIEGYLHWIFEIDIKDSRYKYQIDNLTSEYFYNGKSMGENSVDPIASGKISKKNQKFLTEIDNDIKEIISKLKEFMGRKVENDF